MVLKQHYDIDISLITFEYSYSLVFIDEVLNLQPTLTTGDEVHVLVLLRDEDVIITFLFIYPISRVYVKEIAELYVYAFIKSLQSPYALP
jgi:hypothetical protein